MPIVLYTRRGCHLCELMKAEIERSSRRGEYQLSEVDIDSDAQLVQRWGHSIPVLEIGGQIAFKSKLTPADFERKFERLAEEWRHARALGRANGEAKERT